MAAGPTRNGRGDCGLPERGLQFLTPDPGPAAMTDERRQVIEMLGELSDLYPVMRLGQILTWFAGAARGPRPESIYDAEDAELFQVMRAHLDDKHAAHQSPK